jgi:hypothetical protein
MMADFFSLACILNILYSSSVCLSKQIQRFYRALLILHSLKQEQRFPVRLQSVFRLPGIHQPVAQPLQAPYLKDRISQRGWEGERIAEPYAGLGIVSACP